MVRYANPLGCRFPERTVEIAIYWVLLAHAFLLFGIAPERCLPPVCPSRGLFRGDGFGDEYIRWIFRGFDFVGIEEGGEKRSHGLSALID